MDAKPYNMVKVTLYSPAGVVGWGWVIKELASGKAGLSFSVDPVDSVNQS